MAGNFFDQFDSLAPAAAAAPTATGASADSAPPLTIHGSLPRSPQAPAPAPAPAPVPPSSASAQPLVRVGALPSTPSTPEPQPAVAPLAAAQPAGAPSDPAPAPGPIAAAPASNPSPIGASMAAARGAGQGMTLGWLDRLDALRAASPFAGASASSPTADSIPNVGPFSVIPGALRLVAEDLAPSIFGNGGHAAYNRAFAADRTITKAAEAQHPYPYLGGELGGGLASALVAPAIQPFEGANVATRALAGAGNLAASGGVYGALAGAGGASSASQMPQDAAEGAGAGAALSTVLGGAGGVAGKILGNLGSHFMASVSPATVAVRDLANRLSQSGADLPAIAQKVQAAQTAGVPGYTFADAAGPDLQGLVGTMARQRGPAKAPTVKFLGERQFGSTPDNGLRARLDGYVSDLFGGDGSLATATKLAAQRKADAAPLYEAAHSDPISLTPQLQALLPRLQRSGALSYAQNLMKLEGVPFDVGTLAPWDYMQRALDDRATMAMRKGQNNMGRIYGKIRGALNDQLDAQSPNFAAARAQYAGDSNMMDALQAGQNAFRPSYTREQVAADLKPLTESERAMYRLGAGNALREQMANQSFLGTLPNGFKTNSATAQKIRLLAPDQNSYDRFGQQMSAEGDMLKTKKAAIEGSATEERMADDKNTDLALLNAMSTVGDVVKGNWAGILESVLRYAGKINPAKRGQVLEQARQLALTPGPDAAQALVKQIQNVGLPKGSQAIITRALQPMINQPRAAPSSPGATPSPDEPSPAWRLLRSVQDGSLNLWNPQTNQIVPYAPQAQPGG